VADPEDGGGGEGGLWAVHPDGVQGAELPLEGLGGEAPRSWSINTFCVMVKTVSVNTKMSKISA